MQKTKKENTINDSDLFLLLNEDSVNKQTLFVPEMCKKIKYIKIQKNEDYKLLKKQIKAAIETNSEVIQTLICIDNVIEQENREYSLINAYTLPVQISYLGAIMSVVIGFIINSYQCNHLFIVALLLLSYFLILYIYKKIGKRKKLLTKMSFLKLVKSILLLEVGIDYTGNKDDFSYLFGIEKNLKIKKKRI